MQFNNRMTGAEGFLGRKSLLQIAAKAAGLLLVSGLAQELSLPGDGDVNPAALIPSSPMAKDAKMMPR